MVGACLAAAIFSNFAQLMNKADASSARYQDQLQNIHEFIRLYRLPPDAQRILLEYHELAFSAYRGLNMKHVAQQVFPHHVQSRVFYQLHKSIILQLPIFHGCDTSFLEQLVLQLGTQVVLAGDFVFRKNDLGELMYFLQFGEMEIGNEDCSVIYATLEPGAYFGEVAVFSNDRRMASARAKLDAILYTLSKSGFEEIAIRYPDAYRKVYAKFSAAIRDLKRNSKRIHQPEDAASAKPPVIMSPPYHGRQPREPPPAPPSPPSSTGLASCHTIGSHGSRSHGFSACGTQSPPPSPPPFDATDAMLLESGDSPGSEPKVRIPQGLKMILDQLTDAQRDAVITYIGAVPIAGGGPLPSSQPLATALSSAADLASSAPQQPVPMPHGGSSGGASGAAGGCSGGSGGASGGGGSDGAHSARLSTVALPIVPVGVRSSRPPVTLAPLFSGQALSTLREEVLPLLHGLMEQQRQLANSSGAIGSPARRSSQSGQSPTAARPPGAATGSSSAVASAAERSSEKPPRPKSWAQPLSSALDIFAGGMHKLSA